VYDLITGKELTSVVLRVNVDNKIGKLRSYYYNDSNLKTIYSTDAGTINYETGKITLKNFSPIGIDDPLKRLKLYATPDSSLFSSDKNSILTIDNEDSAAVSVTATPIK
jgi:hypothetical protein